VEMLTTLKELYNSGISPTLLNLLVIVILLYVWEMRIHPILRRWSYAKLLKSRSKLDMTVIDKLRQYQELMLCDRLSIYEFHNTAHNLYGKSFLKFTCTYEVARLGVRSYNINRKDISTGGHKEILQMIDDEQIIKIDKLDLNKFTPELLEYLKDGGIQSSLLIPMLFKGAIYGFITVEFTRAENFSSEDIDKIIKNAYILIGEISSKVCKGK